jgi:hypothetical protein
VDPIGIAKDLASFVTEYELDGVDVDYEDFAAFNKGDGSAIGWLIALTIELRSLLPSPYIISHAPVAPCKSLISFDKIRVNTIWKGLPTMEHTKFLESIKKEDIYILTLW